MCENDFEIGQEVELTLYDYNDDFDETIIYKKGVVVQKTKNLLTIDNGKYKESFRYSDMKRKQVFDKNGIAHENTPEDYHSEIVADCIKAVTSKKEGWIFNPSQLKEVVDYLDKNNIKWKVREENHILFVKSIDI